MIPKNIYYVWVGGNEKPEVFNKCLKSWQENLPDYNIIEINESNFDLQYHLDNNKFFKKCYERKMWAFVSDYMRVIHLYENGGIYLDIDMQIIKNFSTLIDKEVKFFAGFEDENIVNAAIVGAIKGSEILKSVIDFYNNEIWISPFFTIPHILTSILNSHINTKGKLKHSYISDSIKLFPAIYFYPYHYNESYNDECITKNTYGIHWWGHSWNKEDDYIFLRTKHMNGWKKKSVAFIIKGKYRLLNLKNLLHNKSK